MMADWELPNLFCVEVASLKGPLANNLWFEPLG